LPLHFPKNNLAKMLRRRVDIIILNEAKQGESGPDLFRAACDIGVEGIVSKHKDRPYRAGRSPHWIKVKNRTSPAMTGRRACFDEDRTDLRRRQTSALDRITDSTRTSPHVRNVPTGDMVWARTSRLFPLSSPKSRSWVGYTSQ
jgi:type IV secretory pathway ATPase VirB11/archaellum biosynthesis ATPase